MLLSLDMPDGKNACRVSRTQDVHTRQRLDIVFDGLSVERGDVYIWDPSEHFSLLMVLLTLLIVQGNIL